MGQITFNDLLSLEAKRDPIQFSAHVREMGPLLRFASPFTLEDGWLITGYAQGSEVLRDQRFLKDPQKFARAESEQAPKRNTFFTTRRDLFTVDPPDHTRLRGLLSKAFTPRMIEQLRPRIQQITDELLDAVQAQGNMDLIADFAFPLPITVISEMLGIPVADRQQFRAWSQNVANGFTGGLDQEKVASALNAFTQYIKALLAEKREHAGNDLVSELVRTEINGDRLQENELISTVFLLIIAGHETTVNLISNSMLALFQHPEQMHLLRSSPALIDSAIEELLRYTFPVFLSSMRWAGEDILLHGEVIRKGEAVFVLLMGANTDPQQFTRPEDLDIMRQENQHLSFGKGIHYCLGAPLARLEGQIAVGTLLQRFPDLHLAVEFEQLNWSNLRGLTSLPVKF